jgi:uncharacterized protein (TIGR02598 family)
MLTSRIPRTTDESESSPPLCFETNAFPVSGIRYPVSGFTLVEIALAVGIFGFAIIGILSVFAVALQSARDSRIESIVPQIAESILSEMRTSEFNASHVRGADLALDLSADAPPPVYVLFDNEGAALAPLARDAYDAGDSDGSFIAKVEATRASAGPPILAKVVVTVEAPAAAPSGRRSVYPFVTLISDTR